MCVYILKNTNITYLITEIENTYNGTIIQFTGNQKGKGIFEAII